jgi:hypothetical protein
MEVFRVPGSTTRLAPGISPRRCTSRRAEESRAETLLMTAGTQQPHLDSFMEISKMESIQDLHIDLSRFRKMSSAERYTVVEQVAAVRQV